MAKNSARDRAEDLLQNVGRMAREWLDAEEGLVQSLRDLVEERGFSPPEVRRRLDELLGRIKAAKVWERVTANDRVIALSDYRDEVEKRVEEVASQIIESLPLARKSEVSALQKQVKTLTRKVNELSKKLEIGPAEEA